MSYFPSANQHGYTDKLVIVQNPLVSTYLTELSSPKCHQPRFNSLLKRVYNLLVHEGINITLPTELQTNATRMTSQHPSVLLESQVIKKNSKAVVVDVARAGMLPSQIMFDTLCQVLDPALVRQDHIFAARATDSENKVTHTELSSAKVGDDISDAYLFIADPMGATGNSICQVLDFYKKKTGTLPKKTLAIHLIVTPEYIQKVSQCHPDLHILTARVDRGLTKSENMTQLLGKNANMEVGLNDMDYIVPGAGGVGELINNCYV